MWDWVGIAGVLLAAVPLTLTLVRDFSRSKRLEQAMRLRDGALEGSYARASLERLVDLEAEAMLTAAVKRRSQLWIALGYAVAVLSVVFGYQAWLRTQPAEMESEATAWLTLVNLVIWGGWAVLWLWRQSQDLASHKAVRVLRPWNDPREND